MIDSIIISHELTDDENRDRLHLERKVERAFFEAGKALQEIRDRRLYRSTHQTFEDYCKARFNFARRRPYQLIDASVVFENLCTICGQNELGNSNTVLPTKEGQVRPLTLLDPKLQVEAWQQSVTRSGGKVPTGRIVKSVVDKIAERIKVPNPYHVGDIVSQGCKNWFVVTEILDFSCRCQHWMSEEILPHKSLREIPYPPEQKQFMQAIMTRFAHIWESSEELCDRSKKTVQKTLEGLAQNTDGWLTQEQQQILDLLEILIN